MAVVKLKVKSPTTERWKKTEALFDPSAEPDTVSLWLLQKLGAKSSPGQREFLEVMVLNEHLLWEFEVVDDSRFPIRFGKNFIQANGVIVEEDKIRFAPGYPRAPVV